MAFTASIHRRSSNPPLQTPLSNIFFSPRLTVFRHIRFPTTAVFINSVGKAMFHVFLSESPAPGPSTSRICRPAHHQVSIPDIHSHKSIFFHMMLWQVHSWAHHPYHGLAQQCFKNLHTLALSLALHSRYSSSSNHLSPNRARRIPTSIKGLNRDRAKSTKKLHKVAASAFTSIAS